MRVLLHAAVLRNHQTVARTYTHGGDMATDVEALPSPASEPGRSRLHVVLSLTRRQRAALEVSAEANGLTTTAEIKRLILKELSYEARLRGREDFAISRLV